MNTNPNTRRVNIVKKLNTTIKKAAAATIIISALSFNSAYASAEYDLQPELQTIYHVYSDDLYLGTVSNKDKVEAVIAEKIAASKKQIKDLDLIYTENQLSLVPEQLLSDEPNSNDEKVFNYLETDFELNVEASALKINDKIVTYLENEEKVADVIQSLKLKYVSEEELQQLEEQKETKEELPQLKPGGTRITDVILTENIEVSQGEVTPDQVLSVSDTLTLLEKGTLEEKKYTVKEGDVLGSIAEEHKLELKQLLELNPQLTDESIIKVGDKLTVTTSKPYVDVIVEKEVSSLETIAHETEVVDDESMYKGDKKVIQDGTDGEKVSVYKISEQNGNQVAKETVSENIVKEPVKEIIHHGTKVIPSRGTGKLIWPADGGYVSSKMGYRWGKQHKGIDIARPSNRTIKAADNGKVVSAGWNSGGYGNLVIIDHNNGIRTLYAHLDSVDVRAGQTVAQGEKIGVMGNTGNSTGVHLHFEVRKNGSMQNPLNYIQ